MNRKRANFNNGGNMAQNKQKKQSLEVIVGKGKVKSYKSRSECAKELLTEEHWALSERAIADFTEMAVPTVRRIDEKYGIRGPQNPKYAPKKATA